MDVLPYRRGPMRKSFPPSRMVAATWLISFSRFTSSPAPSSRPNWKGFSMALKCIIPFSLIQSSVLTRKFVDKVPLWEPDRRHRGTQRPLRPSLAHPQQAPAVSVDLNRCRQGSCSFSHDFSLVL